MATTSNPQVSISLLPAQLASSINGRNDLICGTFPSSASAVDGTLYTDVLTNYTETELDTLFGANSDVRNKINQFSLSNGGYSALDVKVIAEDASGVQAIGTLTFGTDGSGAATEAGDIVVSMVDEYQFQKTISVPLAATDIEVIALIVAAFSSTNFPLLPVTVAEGSSTWIADVTAIDDGTTGNYYKLAIEGTIPGLGTLVIIQPTGGATDPSLTDFFDDLSSTRFTGINWPTAWSSDVSIVQTYLDDRFNTDNAILDGVAFIGLNDTYSNNNDVVDDLNSQSLCFGGNQQLHDTDQISYFKPADWDMIYFQGIRSRRLTEDAPIADWVTTTSGPLDAFGGSSLASLPLFNSPLKATSIVNANNLYSSTEQSELEESGYSVFGVNSASNLMITGPMVTTYTTDASGNANESFHYLNYVDTASICRELFFNNLKSRFAQSRLTNGTLVAGRSMENEESIEAEFIKIYKQLSQLALTVAGAASEKYFQQELSLTLDLASRSVTAIYQLPIVTQFGSIIATAQLNFNFQES